MGMKTAALVAVLLLVVTSGAQAGTVLQLKAENYDPTTGIWSDTSGLNNHAVQGLPTDRPGLVPAQTVSGSSVVRFDGSHDHLNLTSPILPSGVSGITAFAFLKATGTGVNSILAGESNGSFQYRIYANAQQLLRSGQALLGSGTAPVSPTEFSSINVATTGAGGEFRLDGAPDGVFGPTGAFGPITRVGIRFPFGGIEVFGGDIAEIRIYDTLLTAGEVAAVEAELNATYNVVAAPLPAAAWAGLGLLGLIGAIRKVRRKSFA